MLVQDPLVLCLIVFLVNFLVSPFRSLFFFNERGFVLTLQLHVVINR